MLVYRRHLQPTLYLRNFDDFDEDPEIVVIKHVILKIEEYIRIVNPSNLIMISLDGTPPVAKLEQQRQRRYKSWYTERTLQDMSPTPSKESVFNTIKITTGTLFMKKLNQGLTDHFSNPSDYNVNEFVVSTSDDPGEGESKIYERIRKDENIHYKKYKGARGEERKGQLTQHWKRKTRSLHYGQKNTSPSR